MSRTFALTQKVNFYVSVTFILAFGLFMTTTVVQAINRDGTDIRYMSMNTELTQLSQ